MSRPRVRLLAGGLLGLLAFVGVGRAFEAVGKIIKVDADRGEVVVFAGGQERRVRVAKDVKVLDEKDKALPDGLKSKALKEGAEVTLTVEQGGDGRPTITAIRLGRKPGVGGGRGGGAPPKVDTSKLKPLPELGAGEYKGFQGGFYPGGKNERPRAHEAAGLALAKQVRLLDAEGKPSADGTIVVMSVGMSNTNQAWAGFMRVARDVRDINPHVKLVNGAVGGVTASRMQTEEGPGARYWNTVDERLKAAGVTREQVQAAWIKQADAGPSEGFPGYAKKLEGELANVVRVLRRRFPNLKLVYLSSRTYGGYAKTRLNPEPYAYESGFAVKWLIEKQINGDPGLNYDAKKGKVNAPWLSWGPYLWANGSTKRADGFAYEERDFAADGTHESPSGQAKVGKLLLQFFKTDSTTRPWFIKGGG